MKVLGIETSSACGSVALVHDGQLLGERSHAQANRHAEVLVPLLDQLLAEANLNRRSVDMVAVGLGPGSFTGLRVGIALASGIALGLGVPLVGVPSLVALAHGLQLGQSHFAHDLSGTEWLGALVDARRGEYFFAAFNRQLECVIPACLLSYEGVETELASLMGARSICIAGEAAKRQLPSRWLPPGAHAAHPVSATPGEYALYPSATSVALLAQTSHASANTAPLYLRDADAKRPTLPPNPLAMGRSPHS